MAEKIGREADPARVVAMITQMAGDAILVELAARFPEHKDKLDRLYQKCSVEARAQLIKELGDPTPHRLA